MTHQPHNTQPGQDRHTLPFPVSPAIPAVAGGFLVAAVFLLSRGSADGMRRFWLAYVQAFAFVLSLSLGALFFVLIQHLTRAGWSVVVRRPAEILAANFGVLIVAFLPIAGTVAGGSGLLYRWARPLHVTQEAHARGSPLLPAARAAEPTEPPRAGGSAAQADGHDHDAHGGLDELTLKKRPWLNGPFFLARWAAYLVIWAVCGWFLLARSTEQDASGDPRLTLRLQYPSGAMTLLFGLTVTFAAFDLLMSLDAHWFSTIFGVYYFAGSVVGFLAVLILGLMLLQRLGLLRASVTVEHYHDLGKLLFAFVFFWGYIAFSQYMLIWYGNLPEETAWFARRGASTAEPNAWSAVALVLLLGHFVLPFAGLLSRHAKRSRAMLGGWAAWLLAMHWLDLYWLVMPEAPAAAWPPALAEIGCSAGLIGLFIAGLLRLASGRSLLAARDPRLPESLAFHNP